jgi:2-methylaconitate isomerase
MERPVVDLGANCGNLSSAVGPFAVDQRRCPRADGPALVRVHNTNTGGLIHARFAVSGGCAETRGDMAIPGVAGTGAPIRLDFLDPGGAPPAACSPPATRSTRSSWTAPAGSGCHWSTRPTPISPPSVRPGRSAPSTAAWWPPPTHDVGVPMLSMERAHRAVPVTGALCLAVACRVPGTVARALAAAPAGGGNPVRVGNPSGVVQVAAPAG